MDFTKFISLIATQRLPFPRSDQFKDPFEGSLPYNLSTQKLRDEIAKGGDKSVIENSRQRELLDAKSRLVERFRQNIYISCWHANEFESAAMWDLYNADIAIQTTYAALEKQLPGLVYLGMVDYLDYQTVELVRLNLIKLHYCKRSSFAHENEVRALIVDNDPQSEIIRHNVPFDFEACIDKVYVSPTKEQWLADLTSDVLLKYGISTEVIKSDLYGTPLF